MKIRIVAATLIVIVLNACQKEAPKPIHPNVTMFFGDPDNVVARIRCPEAIIDNLDIPLTKTSPNQIGELTDNAVCEGEKLIVSPRGEVK